MKEQKVGLFSGGQDSLVACLVSNVREVVYCRTGVGLNEDYVKEICKRFNWKLNIVEPAKHETYEEYVKKYGFPHQHVHRFIMAWIKARPVRRWHSEQKKKGRKIIFVSGRRRKESRARMKLPTNTEYCSYDGMDWHQPILNWSITEVRDYLKGKNVKRCPIYDTMHISGDCFCGSFSHKGEAVAMNMFHPELAKWISDLEKKYGGRWGNQTSMTNAKEQGSLEDFICSECQI